MNRHTWFFVIFYLLSASWAAKALQRGLARLETQAGDSLTSYASIGFIALAPLIIVGVIHIYLFRRN